MLTQDDFLAELSGKFTFKLLSQLVVKRDDGRDVKNDDIVLVLHHLVVTLGHTGKKRDGHGARP